MALKTTTDKDKSVKKHDYCNTRRSASVKSKHKILKKNIIKKSQVQTRTALPIITNYTPAIVMAMSAFYPQYQHFSCPVALNEWSPIIPVNPSYTVQPIPLIINSTAMLSTPVCPYVAPITIPPVIAPSLIVSNDASPESCYFESGTELESPAESFYGSEGGAKIGIEVEDPIEHYLLLPKDLFPSARMMTMDPNELIDEFCKLKNIYHHASWILDLEFGIPKSPITRHIPSYNVKFNSINCKNTPDAIHPGFESCNQDFKRVLLFYYDCIISAWYRGYVLLNYDRSVENFQSWLMLPMQVLGMCWP